VQDARDKISNLSSQRVNVAKEAYTNQADLESTRETAADLRKYSS